MSVASRLVAFSKNPTSPAQFLRLAHECGAQIHAHKDWVIPLSQAIQQLPRLVSSTSASSSSSSSSSPSNIPPGFWDDTARALKPLVPTFPTRQVAVTAHAVAQVPIPTDFIHYLVKVLRDRNAEFSSIDVSHLFNAFARTRVKPENLPNLLTVRPRNPQSIACMLHGATRLELGEKEFLEESFLLNLHAALPELTPQDMCMVLWSYAQMSRGRAVVKFVAEESVRLVKDMKEIELVMAVTALGKAKVFSTRINEELDEMLTEEFLCEKMAPHNVVILCNALTKWPAQTAVRILGRALNRTNWDMSPKHGALLLQSYARIGFRSEALFDRILKKLDLSSLTPMNASHVMVALAKADVNRPPEDFYRYVSRRITEFSDASLVGLLYSWLHYHYFNTGPVAELLLEANRREIDSASFALQSASALRYFYLFCGDNGVNLSKCPLKLLRALRLINNRSTKWQNHSNFFNIHHSNFQSEVEAALFPNEVLGDAAPEDNVMRIYKTKEDMYRRKNMISKEASGAMNDDTINETVAVEYLEPDGSKAKKDANENENASHPHFTIIREARALPFQLDLLLIPKLKAL